jgi:hypothetical protein
MIHLPIRYDDSSGDILDAQGRLLARVSFTATDAEGHVVGRAIVNSLNWRAVPIQAETPVRVWYESAGRMTRHDLDDGETIGIVTPDDARDVTIIAAHPRHVYVAEGVPQYEG